MKLYKSIEEFYLSHFYIVIPLAIILIACVGSFGAYYITLKGMTVLNFTMLFFCVAGAMAYLTSILGQLARKTSFQIFFFRDSFIDNQFTFLIQA